MSRSSCTLEPFTGKFSFFSLEIPQFGFLSHVNSLRFSSGLSGWVLTLSTDYVARTCLYSPHSLVVDVSVWTTSLLAVAVRCIFCGVFFFLLPVMSPQIHLWEGFQLFGNFSFTTLSPGWFSFPNFLFLFLSFIFCPTSFWREWAALLGAWCPLPVFRSCFVEVAQHSNDLLMNLCGRKRFLHPIPLPSWDCPQNHFLKVKF